MKVRCASAAGIKAGRSVRSFRLKIFATTRRSVGGLGHPWVRRNVLICNVFKTKFRAPTVDKARG